MRVLAFDTATALTAVALRDVDAEGPQDNVCMRAIVDLAVADDPPAGGRPGHAQKLLTLIDELLRDAGGGWQQVQRIAVGVGPGTFTGLRIGIATAQALGRSAGVPVVGVSTLRSLALAAHDHEPQAAKLAVIDARRGEAFVAAWAAHDDPLTAGPAVAPCVLAPEQLQRLAAGVGTRALAVGDGALKFGELLAGAGVAVPGVDSPLHRVSARQHARLAAAASKPPLTGETIEPQYLRRPDAELTARR